jgi:hypothetical protein
MFIFLGLNQSFRVLISLLIKHVNFEEGMNHLY